MKLFWTGTDSLMLVNYSMRKFMKKPYWFIFRILIRVLDFFIDEHYCDADNVADNVKKFGTKRPVTVFRDKVKYPVKFDKIPHEGFNVIYYNPTSRSDKQFARWLYGLDIIDKVKESMPEVNFIELDGTFKMEDIYPITDFMIRPNRHDGASRTRQECDINNIPYYWTNKEPNITDCINAIKFKYNEKR